MAFSKIFSLSLFCLVSLTSSALLADHGCADDGCADVGCADSGRVKAGCSLGKLSKFRPKRVGCGVASRTSGALSQIKSNIHDHQAMISGEIYKVDTGSLWTNYCNEKNSSSCNSCDSCFKRLSGISFGTKGRPKRVATGCDEYAGRKSVCGCADFGCGGSCRKSIGSNFSAHRPFVFGGNLRKFGGHDYAGTVSGCSDPYVPTGRFQPLPPRAGNPCPCTSPDPYGLPGESAVTPVVDPELSETVPTKATMRTTIPRKFER